MLGESLPTPADDKRRQVNIRVDARKATLMAKICEIQGITQVELFDKFLDTIIRDNADALREDIAADAARSAGQLAVIDALTSEIRH